MSFGHHYIYAEVETWNKRKQSSGMVLYLGLYRCNVAVPCVWRNVFPLNRGCFRYQANHIFRLEKDYLAKRTKEQEEAVELRVSLVLFTVFVGDGFRVQCWTDLSPFVKHREFAFPQTTLERVFHI